VNQETCRITRFGKKDGGTRAIPQNYESLDRFSTSIHPPDSIAQLLFTKALSRDRANPLQNETVLISNENFLISNQTDAIETQTFLVSTQNFLISNQNALTSNKNDPTQTPIHLTPNKNVPICHENVPI
jgi:hypothetical protein